MTTSTTSSSTTKTTTTTTSGVTMDKMILRTRVAILGAGAAGLQCAASLVSQGWKEVLVLEARNRIGGRILSTRHLQTHEDGNSSSILVRDHGAAYVHGLGDKGGGVFENPMVHLVQQTKQGLNNLQPLFSGNPWTRPDTVLLKKNQLGIYINGTLMDKTGDPHGNVVQAAIEQHYHFRRNAAAECERMFTEGDGMKTVSTSVHETISKLKKKDQQQQQPRPTVEASNGTIATTGYDKEEQINELVSFFSFLHDNWEGQSACDRQVNSLGNDPHRDELENLNGAENSTRPPTDQAYIPTGDFEGPHCKVQLGMDSVLVPLCEAIGSSRIHLGDPVVALEYDHDKKAEDDNACIEIRTANGVRIHTDFCVSTLPLGCLRHSICDKVHQQFPDPIEDNTDVDEGVIRFLPPLSNAKKEAVQSISTGAYKKVFLTFDQVFWPRDKHMLGLIGSSASKFSIGNYLLAQNIWAKTGMPCLEVVLCGRSGKWSIGRPHEEIEEQVLGLMSEAMGLDVACLRERLLSCHVTRWEEDPYSRGSYSSFQLGTLERHVDTFLDAEWDGQLIFAGEHTDSEHMGAVHAALRSGIRAAKEVMKELSP